MASLLVPGRGVAPESVALATARPCRLDRLVDDHEELGRERVEVHMVAQAAAERLDRLGHVVAAPVEAPVHRRLGAAPGWLEPRCHRLGGLETTQDDGRPPRSPNSWPKTRTWTP